MAHDQEIDSQILAEADAFDKELTAMVESGAADSYTEAIEHIRLEDSAEWRRVPQIKQLCDTTLGIDDGTDSEGKPEVVHRKKLSGSLEVTALIFDHKKMAREYQITQYSEGGRYRTETILLQYRDGRQAAVVESYEGRRGSDVLRNQRPATDLQLHDTQYALESALAR